MKNLILMSMLLVSSLANASDSDLLAMVYAGPSHAEQQAAIESLQEDVKDLQDSVKSIESRLAAMQPCDKCDNCKCVDCDCNDLEVPVVEFTAPRPLQVSGVTLHGKSIDPDSYIAEHRGYDAPHWSIHNDGNIANVHRHLREHGFGGFEGLPKSKLMALHQANHHAVAGVTTRSIQAPAPRSTTITRIPQSRSGCANGNCSRPRMRWFSRRM